MSDSPNIEYVINGDEVLVINHDILDPNGQPLITYLTLQQYNQITGNTA